MQVLQLLSVALVERDRSERDIHSTEKGEGERGPVCLSAHAFIRLEIERCRWRRRWRCAAMRVICGRKRGEWAASGESAA
ncbi:hypothetical protein SKAU_G00404740 [Synaphobranchus kaupii]|uniref:Uncharacterized protein n=1 Tax=Synaphobranchus kaupii TaxID=118154 RepID=A0A9Q1E9T9_SYNKA|nr:hypothetical protein SKAU_G00404740 [Synaphobranchus kaupii]